MLLVALALLLGVFTGILVYEMRHPPRRTAAYAVARGLAIDPEAAGLPFREWSVYAHQATLPVWDISPGSAENHASNRSAIFDGSVVFVHGWGQSRIDMLTRIEPWPTIARRIILFDQRGHGEASAPGTSSLGVNEANDLLAVLDALDENEPIVLVGFSMGAVVALEAAAMESRLQQRIAGVIAFGPYVDFHTSLRGRLTVSGYPTRPFTDLALFMLRCAGNRHRPLLRAIRTLHCPLLVMHGERDRVVPLEHGKRIADAAPQGSLCVIPTGAHLDLHLADPDAVNEAITQFVTALPGSPASRPLAARLGH